MKILFSQTYYLPYVSGLTIYAQRVAGGLVSRGHDVEMLVSQHDKRLKENETTDGFKVTRVPYLFFLHKGFFSPLWPLISLKKVVSNEVVICNLPQVEAFWLLIYAKLFKKRSVVIYTCEVKLPSSSINRLIENALYFFNWLSCLLAGKIVCYTKDYAENTRLLKHFKNKQVCILPPILISKEGEEITERINKQINRQPGEYIIGFAARISAEKGLEYLLEAIPLVEKQGVKIKVVCAGPRKEVVGEEHYFKKITQLADNLSGKVIFLGTLNFQEMRSFYKSIDLLVLPSLNSTEAFGIVQGEAMLCGKPVIASDLPGVRVPIRITGMGKVVLPGNTVELAKAITEVLSDKQDSFKLKPKAEIIFNINLVINEYEKLLG